MQGHLWNCCRQQIHQKTNIGNEEYVGFVVYDSALDENGQMKRNENGEIIGDEDRIIIFATEDGLIDMLGYRHWAGDATFDSCPELFLSAYVG